MSEAGRRTDGRQRKCVLPRAGLIELKSRVGLGTGWIPGWGLIERRRKLFHAVGDVSADEEAVTGRADHGVRNIDKGKDVRIRVGRRRRS